MAHLNDKREKFGLVAPRRQVFVLFFRLIHFHFIFFDIFENNEHYLRNNEKNEVKNDNKE